MVVISEENFGIHVQIANPYFMTYDTWLTVYSYVAQLNFQIIQTRIPLKDLLFHVNLIAENIPLDPQIFPPKQLQDQLGEPWRRLLGVANQSFYQYFS